MLNPFFHVLSNCVEKDIKKILVIYDKSTTGFLAQIEKAGNGLDKQIEFVEIELGGRHGVEPDVVVATKMENSELVMCLTRYSLAHTAARNNLTNKGIPFLSMPDYNLQMLQNPSHYAEYKKIYPSVKKYSEILSNGSLVRILTENGSNLTMSIKDRFGSCCPGLVNDSNLLGSPPDIEANIAPVENETNGILVIDGSITDYRIGLLDKPMILKICNGIITSFESEDKINEEIVIGIFREVNAVNAYYVGELGIGFNDKAEMCGNMLIDEGTKGCIHFGMGSNWTIGGMNRVSFHLDFVMRDATVFVDDIMIIDKGVLLYE